MQKLNTGAFEEQERIVQFPDDQLRRLPRPSRLGKKEVAEDVEVRGKTHLDNVSEEAET